ncbi:MAG: universal stress protein [Armatimonadota bacterium]|nr:universal stress protein [Armatimonadota bacterium]
MQPTGPIHVRRILAATDFSPGAERALLWARTLADAFGAELVILHVLDLSLAGAAGLPTELAAMPAVGQLMDRLRSEASSEMTKLAARHPRARTLLREGSPRTTILDVAREVGADLIVVGTHGRTGLAHVFFGSVAEHVVRHSPVPVLTVRQE